MNLDLLESSDIIVCLGTGGVGKTTTAAAVALAGAKIGRHVCVVTIDPAKRLADAMGIGSLDNNPKKIETEPSIDMWAMMLDSNATFDDLVKRFANSKEQAEKILSNSIYKNLVENLSGTQEYMAMEKIYELAADKRFDLLVIDTPPARNAIEFLNAPGRLIGFLDNRVFRLLISPGHGILKTVTIATRLLLKTISKVVGSQVVDDAIEFFQSFEGMEEGFRKRASEVQNLLSRDTTSFVLVTGTHRDTIDEALYFQSRLSDHELKVDAIISNKLTPDFEPSPQLVKQIPEEIAKNLAYLSRLRTAELSQLKRLTKIMSRDRHILVPMLAHDISSLAEIAEISTLICDPKSRFSESFEA